MVLQMIVMRCNFINRAFAICFLLLPLGRGYAQPLDKKNPNVLLIMADDLSSVFFLKKTGEIITPNLDRLIKTGRLFTRAYCQSALCNPSRSSMLTGRRPHELKIWNLESHFRGVYPGIVTLPQYFKNQGYHTVGIGKIYHNIGQSIQGDPASWSEPQIYNWANHSWDWYVPGLPYDIHPEVGRNEATQCVDVPDEAYLDGRIANAAVEKLKILREVPFFLAVGFWKPHLPYNAPKKYWDFYDRNNLPDLKYDQPVAGVPSLAYVIPNEAEKYKNVAIDGKIPPSKLQELRHGYFASISYMDAQLGKILDELDRLNLTQNTIVVFVSDNGYHSGEMGQFGKRTNFEEGANVPLIISAPQMQQKGTASSSLVELVDIYPTLVDYCHLPPAPDAARLAGTSLVPILNNPSHTVKTYATTQITRPNGGGKEIQILGSSIRDERFRYNAWVDVKTSKIVAEELYDLSEDVYQVQNEVLNPRYSKEKKKLHNIFLTFDK